MAVSIRQCQEDRHQRLTRKRRSSAIQCRSAGITGRFRWPTTWPTESDRLHDQYVIPAPCRPLFQAGLANFAPRSEARGDTKAPRGRLLLLAGSVDRAVPAATVRAAYKIHTKHNGGITEF